MSALFRLYAPEECGKDGYPLAWKICPRCEGHGWIAAATDKGHPEGNCRKPMQTAWMDTDGFVAHCCDSLDGCSLCHGAGSIKDLVRRQAGHRCIRCYHPFKVGESGEMVGPSAETKSFAADMGLSVETFDQIFLDADGRGLDLGPEKELDVLERARRVNWSDCAADCRHGGPLRALGSYGVDWRDVPELQGDRVAGDLVRELESELRPKSAPVQAAWRILTVHHLDEVKANCHWWNLTALCQRCHLYIQRKVTMENPWPWDHTDWFQPYAAAWYAHKYLALALTREETMERLDELLALGQQEEGVERMAL